MNEQQAKEQCEALNLLIEEYLEFIRFYVYQYWDSQYNKIYGTLLMPFKYNDSYYSASESIQIAFKRVSTQSLLINYETAEGIVTNFDKLIPSDEELSKYLGIKDTDLNTK